MKLSMFFALVCSAALTLHLTCPPNPYVSAVFHVLNKDRHAPASALLRQLPTMRASNLTKFLSDVRKFLDSESFIKNLSDKDEKPLFEKALTDGLRTMEFEGISAQQKTNVRRIIGNFNDIPRSTFVAHLTRVGYENPATFDSWYTAPEVLFTPSPTKTPPRHPTTPPSPKSSESYYTSSASRGTPKMSPKTTVLPAAFSTARKKPTQRQPATRIVRAQHPLPPQERRPKPNKKTHRQTVAAALAAHAAPASAPALKKMTPTVMLDLSHDASYSEEDMPSLHEITRAIDPAFAPRLYKVEDSLSRQPSPTLSDFAVDESIFATPALALRGPSPASSLSEVGLPSDTDSRKSSARPLGFAAPRTAKTRGKSKLYTEQRPRARASSSDSSASERRPQRKKGGRLKPLKDRHRKQRKNLFLGYEKEANELLKKSESLLDQHKTVSHPLGFVAPTE